MEIIFKKGIPGFEALKKFELVDIEGNSKFRILKSLEEEVSFVTADPFEFKLEYEFDLNDEIISELEIESSSDVLVIGIVTLGKTLDKSTINLKAPLIINLKNNLGKQYILQCDEYKTKHPFVRGEENVSNY